MLLHLRHVIIGPRPDGEAHARGGLHALEAELSEEIREEPPVVVASLARAAHHLVHAPLPAVDEHELQLRRAWRGVALNTSMNE